METAPTLWMSRLLFQRAMGVLYLIAFVIALNQFRPLLGERGLLPVPQYVKEASFLQSPSLFFLWPKDIAFQAAAWIGILLSIVVIAGLADRYSVGVSFAVWGALWILYLSFVNVGQIFYGFGWESILLEAGFYTMFLGPRGVAPPRVIFWLLWWLLFRVMFGAGLIKLRGDPCWRDLTCLNYHYETQPMPNPFSWYLHWGPEWTRKAGVVINHIAELIVPWGYFLIAPVRAVAGILTMVFQALIMVSGNLSFLNALTFVLTIPTLDDRWLGIPLALRRTFIRPPDPTLQMLAWIVAGITVLLSINPVRNMISARQMMNFSYNPLHLVGTYGAFGGITRSRDEIVIEGTDDTVIGPGTVWKAYEFKGKPGDPERRPPQIAPYHLRLDWLMWFAAMGSYAQHPWFLHLVEKLLQGDPATLALLRDNPFSRRPPHFIRAELYRYRFSTPDEKRKTGAWWVRQWQADYFPAVALDTPGFQRVLEQLGWS